jgi:glycosyltransferase involved in cell wall biosynthesis
MKFSVICALHTPREHLLKRLLNSVFDQDYRDIEVIVVQDGPIGQITRETVDQYVNVKLLTNGEAAPGHAPEARNIGFKASSGDTIVFVDADTYFHPGAFTIYKAALDDHPEAAFVYGGYEIVGGGAIPTMPWDAYALETKNYIGGTQAIRRKWFPGWTPGIKSLQDWDMWLTIRDRGGHGVYIPDLLYATEPPGQDSISADSSKNWLERLEAVKARHNIPIRDICVASLGGPFHALRVARLIDADFNNENWYRPNRYRLLILLGFFAETSGGIDAHLQVLGGCNPDCKKVVYLIGSDILQLQNMPQYSWRQAREFFEAEVDDIYVEYETTRLEVEERLGIKAKVMPHPVDAGLFEAGPYPEKFTVAMNHGQSQVYQIDQNLSIARHMPDIDFKIYGNAVVDSEWIKALPPNVEFVGWVDEDKMPDFIQSTSCLLRACIHDGWSISHAEWVLSGRQVLSNMPNRPGALCVPDGPMNIAQGLRLLQERTNAKPDGERLKMRTKYAKMLNPDKFKGVMRGYID